MKHILSVSFQYFNKPAWNAGKILATEIFKTIATNSFPKWALLKKNKGTWIQQYIKKLSLFILNWCTILHWIIVKNEGSPQNWLKKQLEPADSLNLFSLMCENTCVFPALKIQPFFRRNMRFSQGSLVSSCAG